MFAVIFEVQPRKQRFEDYLDLAKLLKPELEKIEGFIDNERFASRRTEGRVLSLSTWRDEKALIRWRTLRAHHVVQEKGRFEVFEDYHLRVGEIVADTAAENPLAVQRLDETEAGAARAATLSELAAFDGKAATADLAAGLGLPGEGTEGLVAHEVFESIYNPGKLLLLAAWADAAAAGRWRPQPIREGLRHRGLRIIRDYEMNDRREAPQFYAPVPRAHLGHPSRQR